MQLPHTRPHRGSTPYRFDDRSSAHRAMTKSSRTMRLPSPMYFCTSSPPDTRMKVQSVWCATARASSVLPAGGAT